MLYDNHPEHDTSASDNRDEIQRLRDELKRVTGDNQTHQVYIVERRGPNRLVRRQCDFPAQLTHIQAILLYAGDFAISIETAYYTISWYIHGKELRIYHDAKDTAHYYQVTICAKKEENTSSE